jgi:hypothetical protein
LSVILGDSTNLQEVLTLFAAFLRGPLTQKKEKWRTTGSIVSPSQRFVEYPRRFGIKYFNWLSKIEGPFSKLKKNRSGSHSELL